MSRYTEGDWDDENAEFKAAAWNRNAQLALKGKRGQKALRELREALMALPEKRLIEGAVCTVGADERRAVHKAQAIR